MRRIRLHPLILVLPVAVASASVLLGAQARPSGDPPLLPPAQATAIAGEVSGGAALRDVRALSLHHHMRVSDGYRAAAEIVRSRLAAFGLAETELIELPADGSIFYGTQRSRPAWNASFAELWEQRQEGGRWVDAVRVASWAEQPISLAQDSVRGGAEADLVDAGAGTEASDYEGKDVRGKLVLVSAQPEAVEALAVGRYGAAGIVSWAQNQKTAWWGLDDSLVRWGHLLTFRSSRETSRLPWSGSASP